MDNDDETPVSGETARSLEPLRKKRDLLLKIIQDEMWDDLEEEDKVQVVALYDEADNVLKQIDGQDRELSARIDDLFATIRRRVESN